MRRMLFKSHQFSFVLFILLFAACNDPVSSIGNSHVESNAPSTETFDKVLKRDLEDYFKTPGKEITINFELLRKVATQSGVSYPKYYIWVKIRDGNLILNEGAVRVAAIGKEKFKVTDFISKRDIQTNTVIVEHVFPKALVDIIRTRAGL
ncbi:MAG: hypothetical protein IT362_01570 [Deltaproteobacteria bacterium]|nr:hypothetical protein [Deltaproteobacteria bacterium]